MDFDLQDQDQSDLAKNGYIGVSTFSFVSWSDAFFKVMNQVEGA